MSTNKTSDFIPYDLWYPVRVNGYGKGNGHVYRDGSGYGDGYGDGDGDGDGTLTPFFGHCYTNCIEDHYNNWKIAGEI